MEEGVINGIRRRSRVRELFSPDNFIVSESGSGNNWSVGYHHYGPIYEEQVLEAVRVQAEQCDALASLFSVGSVGGGTGSGLGSYIMRLLADHYAEVTKFCASVLPSANDDVVTSPYNSVFSLSELQEHADCILPLENQALLDLYRRMDTTKHRYGGTAIADVTEPLTGIVGRGFDGVNNLVAHVLLNLTSSMRFSGSLNVDINEIATNLVPFPKLKYLLSTTAPVTLAANVGAALTERHIDQLFTDAFAKENQLVVANPKHSTSLAVALIARGDISLTDMRRNIARLSSTVRFPVWNENAWKVGLCNAAPLKQSHALLSLANSTCISQTLSAISTRFGRLYRRRANLHHYLENMSLEEVKERHVTFRSAIEAYEEVVV